ncbi:MAG: MobF family relaxase [Zavarzinella sp.]
MLRITQQANAGAAKSYFSRSDYLSEDQERPGIWGGKGAERLGLMGLMQRADFEQLCENQTPDGSPLTVRTRGDRTVGYDWTFNAPKSVSLLYGLTRDERILEAFRGAVLETMQEAEGEMQTRVRQRGVEQDRSTGNMVWAEFVHTTSRPVAGVPDPHLHSHVFVFNATFDGEENRWKAGQFRGLKRDARYYEAGFHAHLAEEMQRLGYGVERTRTGWEVAGMGDEVLKKFSRRTAQIEEKAREAGITDPERKAELGAQTREAKNKQLSMSELREDWQGRLDDGEKARLQQLKQVTGVDRGKQVQEGIDFAWQHCFTSSAVVPEKLVVAQALRRGIGGLLPEQAQRFVAERGLVTRQQRDRLWATTPEVLAQEGRVSRFARTGRGTLRAAQSGSHNFQREWLNQDQRQAVEHVLQSRDRVTLIRGIAGTGKTSLMQEAVEGLQQAGLPGVVLAPTAEASRDVLRQEGFAEADTVAMFLQNSQLQERACGGFIWVDEAGLLSLNQSEALFGLAEQLDARVIFSGDQRQHRSVERGDLLTLLEQEAGLPTVTVREIQRQRGSYKQLVADLAEGRIGGAFQKLQNLGWLREIDDPTERYAQVAAEYLQAIRTGRKTLVVSPTHVEGEAVTGTIRQRLQREGVLREERSFTVWKPVHLTEAEKQDPLQYSAGRMIQYHQHAPGRAAGSQWLLDGKEAPVQQSRKFSVFRPEVRHFAVGDWIRITHNGKTKDGKHRLNRGGLYQIAGFGEQGDIRLKNGWEIDAQWGHLDWGYVLTSHASQGKTADQVLVVQSQVSLGATTPEQFYVSASRGRERVLVFTDAAQSLQESLQRETVQPHALPFVRDGLPPAPVRERDYDRV